MNTPTKRVLITGINGFVGSHLAEACGKLGWEVHGTIRSHRSNLDHLADARWAALHPCDITDYASIGDVVGRLSPDVIFHLAAQSYVPASWQAPRQTMDANLGGTMNILEAIRHRSPFTVLQVAGTSEEYGLVHDYECPMDEQQPLRPLSPYGVSKAAADMLARQYAASYGLKVVVTRAFNHTGPRRGDQFAESDWAKQIALAEAAGSDHYEIRHGNLDAIRDYTDVRDIVRGYIAAVERGRPGQVYNLASGAQRSPRMGMVLDTLCSMANVKVVPVPDPARLRPSDVPRLIGDATKAQVELDWRPTIQLNKTLEDLIDYWRDQVGAPAREGEGAVA